MWPTWSWVIDTPRALKLHHGQRKVRVESLLGGERARRDFALDGLGDNAEFLELLRSSRVETLHTLEATLEQIFIEVTGRKLL